MESRDLFCVQLGLNAKDVIAHWALIQQQSKSSRRLLNISELELIFLRFIAFMRIIFYAVISYSLLVCWPFSQGRARASLFVVMMIVMNKKKRKIQKIHQRDDR